MLFSKTPFFLLLLFLCNLLLLAQTARISTAMEHVAIRVGPEAPDAIQVEADALHEWPDAIQVEADHEEVDGIEVDPGANQVEADAIEVEPGAIQAALQVRTITLAATHFPIITSDLHSTGFFVRCRPALTTQSSFGLYLTITHEVK
jgi:hypothetical protein